MDVWVDLNQENAANLVSALKQFGFGSLGLQVDDFLVPDQVVQLGYPPNRIDILLSLKGIDFDSSYASKIQVRVEGVTVNFIDLDNLRKNKKATGRLQDLADLENLE